MLLQLAIIERLRFKVCCTSYAQAQTSVNKDKYFVIHGRDKLVLKHKHGNSYNTVVADGMGIFYFSVRGIH